MKGKATSKQQADIQDKRTTLLRRIQRWREVQLTYIPCVGPILAAALCTQETDGPTPDLAELTPLHLPSALPRHLCDAHNLGTVVEKEKRLRIAQADDALAEIRRQRRIITGLWQFKKLNVAGTGNKPNTRIRSLYNRFHHKTQRCTERYRAAFTALSNLDPNGTWCSRFRVLRTKDISGPGKDDDGTSNGRFEPSWIWLVPRVESAPDMGESEGHLDDSMGPEWAKSQARMKRWEEEVDIIEEEMRRVIAYHEWKAGWWRGQSTLRSIAGIGDPDILDGVEAYAHKQAFIHECLASKCALYWLPTLRIRGLTPEWASRYFSVPTSQTTRSQELAADDLSDLDALDVEELDDNVDDHQAIDVAQEDVPEFYDDEDNATFITNTYLDLDMYELED